MMPPTSARILRTYVTLTLFSTFASSFIWGINTLFINGLIPSEQRATVFSSDNLLASSGGVVFQPTLGRVAEVVQEVPERRLPVR